MWCKKRRRHKEGKSQEDISRSSTNKPSRKDSSKSSNTELLPGQKLGHGANEEKLSLATAVTLKDSLSKVFTQKLPNELGGEVSVPQGVSPGDIASTDRDIHNRISRAISNEECRPSEFASIDSF